MHSLSGCKRHTWYNMSKADKLVSKLLSKPKDFTWNETQTLMKGFGFVVKEGSGSRVKFIHKEDKIIIALHKPHPGNILKEYVVKELIEILKMHKLV